jgi:hypothetical protein
MKKDFLVVYDYGMGGVWAFIKARTKEEITQKYPELIVYNDQELPAWMSDEYCNRIRSIATFEIDDPPSGWLLEMAKQ